MPVSNHSSLAAALGAGQLTVQSIAMSTVDPGTFLGVKGDTRGRVPPAGPPPQSQPPAPAPASAGQVGAGSPPGSPRLDRFPTGGSTASWAQGGQEAETISGAIAQGHIPSMRGARKTPTKPADRPASGLSPWVGERNPSAGPPGRHNYPDLTLDMTSQHREGGSAHQSAASSSWGQSQSPPRSRGGAGLGGEGASPPSREGTPA